MPQVVGIDLGTTNSLVAVMRADGPQVLPDDQGRTLLPSVVHYTTDGSVHVGWDARPSIAAEPERTVYSVKRLMGKGAADVAEERAQLPYALSESGAGPVRVLIGERALTPSQVSAEILRALRARAEAALGEAVTAAVITVPAYFNDSQRQATRDAARIAGLEVLRLVNEPTAASLAYGLDKSGESTIAVYDFGGGTFDISILRVREGLFQVLATGGDTHLGGDDIDRAILEHLQREFSGRLTPSDLEELRLAAEAAKIALSGSESATVQAPLSTGEFRRDLTRAELEEWMRPIVERTLEPCRQALRDAELAASDISEVVLVGGSTRIPLVRWMVEELFGRPPHAEVDPDQVVALGAAVQAGVLTGRFGDILLLDVIPLSLGIETAGGTVEKLIYRNTTISAMAREGFTTAVDNQTGVDIHVVQGERELAVDCRSLARFTLKIDPQPAGMPRVEVTFLVDANGILSVTAIEARTGKEATIEVKPSYGLTEEQVEQMILDSFMLAEEDMALRQLADARVEAETILLGTRKALAEGFDLVDDEEADEIQRAVAFVEEAKLGDDLQTLRHAVERLNNATRDLAERLMNRAVERALKGKTLEEVEARDEAQMD